MKISLRFALGAGAIVLVAMGALLVAAERWFRPNLEAAFIGELERQAHLVAAAVSARPRDLNVAAHRYGTLAQRRVTLISPDGTVLGDSDFDDASLALLDNHAERPEVRSAMAGRTGVARRLSASTNRVEIKVAVAGWPGVVRISAPVDQIDGLVGGATRTTVIVGTLVMIGGAILAVAGGQAIARPVAELARASTAVVAGADPQYPQSNIPEIQDTVRAFRAMNEAHLQRLSELRREREETITLIQSMVEGVIASDERGHVVLCNDAMRGLLGFTPEDRMPSLPELFHQRGAREVVDQVLAGEPVLGREIALDHRTVLMTARPLHTGGAVLSILDVTDLRRVDAVRRDFVANVSHELKTPLTSIVGYAETLLGDDPDETTRANFLSVILDNAHRMQRLVDDLLDLARFESGVWSPRLASLELRALVEEVWAALKAPGEAGGPTLITQVPSDVRVSADREAFQHVLANLIDNAQRHTPVGGRITVSAKPVGEWIQIVVADTGTGIPTEHLNRVFERFYRVDPGRSRHEGGTGLGLAIVKHLIESHDGSVEINSGVGQGTTVRIRIPTRPPDAEGGPVPS